MKPGTIVFHKRQKEMTAEDHAKFQWYVKHDYLGFDIYIEKWQGSTYYMVRKVNLPVNRNLVLKRTS